jgi:hypothetical protein
MKQHWAEEFLNYLRAKDIKCESVRYSQGWLETALICGKICFTKSITFDLKRKQYFQGVDTAKLSDKGDFVLLCGGLDGKFRDIFIIPWKAFFSSLAKANPINTYRDKEYLQYKFVVRERDDRWLLIFHNSAGGPLDVGGWHNDVNSAVAVFKRIGV